MPHKINHHHSKIPSTFHSSVGMLLDSCPYPDSTDIMVDGKQVNLGLRWEAGREDYEHLFLYAYPQMVCIKFREKTLSCTFNPIGKEIWKQISIFTVVFPRQQYQMEIKGRSLLQSSLYFALRLCWNPARGKGGLFFPLSTLFDSFYLF